MVTTAVAAAMLATVLARALLLWSSEPPISSAPPLEVGEAPKAEEPKLFCVFTNFANRTPLVGFHFRIDCAHTAPVYALIFRRESDGSQVDFGSQGVPSPEWTSDGTEDPAVIQAPEDGMQINLYGYEPGRRGTHWFAAGLRSICYKNLGGRCRVGA
jgi:hypothetical protein